MFYKPIVTKKDAVEYLQIGKNASEILERLEQLPILLGQTATSNQPIQF
jgi:hypothetical protein